MDDAKITSRYVDENDVLIDEDNIPQQFRHVLPFARVWAIGDDVEREEYMELIAESSIETLKVFVNAVWPHLPELQKWLDIQNELTPVPDEAVLYGMMCEACAEAGAIHVDPPQTNS